MDENINSSIETSSSDSSYEKKVSVVKESEIKANTSTDSSSIHQNKDLDNSDIDEENKIVKAILDAKKLHRNHPPDIILENYITDICFHPATDIIAIADLGGDIFTYKYNNEETTLVSNIELHLKTCWDIEFNEDGRSLFSTGKDLSILITDMETEKIIRLYEKAHEKSIYTMTIINEYMFVTGDEDGVVKLWDLRQKGSSPIFSIKKVEEYINAMITNKDVKYLVCTSGDGYVTTLNIPERRLHVQSEEYDEELMCLGLFKHESKLLSATSKGKMYVYNWGEFGLHSDEFPSVTKKAINCMIPITENIVITGGEDGIIRASSLFPHYQLGVVGQHELSIEALDINNDGTLIASTSHNNDIKFWNVQYFETLNITEHVKSEKQKCLAHNLPSSKIDNQSGFFAEL